MNTDHSNPIVNDIQLSIASMNGDFSVSTNDALAFSFFRMGLTVSTKRFFPSNIEGDPTRYLIRVNEDGYQAVKDKLDMTIVLFEENAAEDIERVREGGVVMYDPSSSLGQDIHEAREAGDTDSRWYRDDVTYYAVPFEELAEEEFTKPKLRKIMRNVVYVGALFELLEMDLTYIKDIVRENFASKGESVIQSNFDALDLGRSYVQENIEKTDPYHVTAREPHEDKLFMTGNDASAIGSVVGGCTYTSWYPITPASSHGENMEKLSQYTPMIVEQGENEDSCVGRAIGASWAGARAAASSSGPGISNMAEFVGYSSFTETPVVIFDFQRVGPSTGLPTHTKQGDLRSLMHISHDEAPRMILTPSTVEQIYDYSRMAFDLAAQYQMPVFVMSELILGMGGYTVDRFEYPESPPDLGKILDEQELKSLNRQNGGWNRFEDVDGDGVCYRVLPGTEEGTHVVRGSGHAPDTTYTEDPDVYSGLMERLFRKLDTAYQSDDLPRPETFRSNGQHADVGLIGWGSSYDPIREAQDQLAEHGIDTDYLDNAFVLPFPEDEIKSFLESHDRTYIVEQNLTGQFMSVIHENLGRDFDMVPIRRYDGNFLEPSDISDAILEDQS